MDERVREIVLIFAVSVTGAALIFLGQQAFYSTYRIPLNDVRRIGEWVSEKYMIGALVVFGTSVLATLIWYISALKFKGRDQESPRMAVLWWSLLLLPIAGIGIALSAFNGSQDALPSLTAFYVFDVLFLYWFSTAISTPNALKYMVPFSFYLRRLFRI